MAQADIKKLDSRDPFPTMEFKLVDGASLVLPEKGGETWGVLLIYRGIW